MLSIKRTSVNCKSLFFYLLIAMTIVLIVAFVLARENSQRIVRPVPRTLYCAWTGNNEMSSDRKACLETLRQSGLNVVLITPQNLSLYILPSAPLHEGYHYLSETHKSDYLRCYFMHFYGGGYTDIKNTTKSWLPAWEELNSKPTMYANGYAEPSPECVDHHKNAVLDELLHKHYYELIGNGNFLFRPQTPLTKLWYRTLIKTLDDNIQALRIYPRRHAQQTFSPEYPYPFKWAAFSGQIFHPVCFKYRSHLLRTLPAFVPSSYR